MAQLRSIRQGALSGLAGVGISLLLPVMIVVPNEGLAGVISPWVGVVMAVGCLAGVGVYVGISRLNAWHAAGGAETSGQSNYDDGGDPPDMTDLTGGGGIDDG